MLYSWLPSRVCTTVADLVKLLKVLLPIKYVKTVLKLSEIFKLMPRLYLDYLIM